MTMEAALSESQVEARVEISGAGCLLLYHCLLGKLRASLENQVPYENSTSVPQSGGSMKKQVIMKPIEQGSPTPL